MFAARATALAAPQYIASSNSAQYASANANVLCTYPTGVEGDYLILVVNFTRTVAGQYFVPPPTGWKFLCGQNPSGAADGNYIGVFGKFRGAADTSVTVTASTGVSNYGRAWMQSWRGVDPNYPVNACASTYNNVSSTAEPTPDIITTTDNCGMALFVGSFRSANQTAYSYTWTAPPVETQDVTTASASHNTRMGVTDARDTQAVKGTYSSKTCTASVATLGHFACTIALAPYGSIAPVQFSDDFAGTGALNASNWTTSGGGTIDRVSGQANGVGLPSVPISYAMWNTPLPSDTQKSRSTLAGTAQEHSSPTVVVRASGASAPTTTVEFAVTVATGGGGVVIYRTASGVATFGTWCQDAGIMALLVAGCEFEIRAYKTQYQGIINGRIVCTEVIGNVTVPATNHYTGFTLQDDSAVTPPPPPGGPPPRLEDWYAEVM